MSIQVKAILAAFLSSMIYTAMSTGSLFLLLSLTDSSTPAGSLAWAQAHWWSFLVAQVITPLLRAHAAANLYAPDAPARPSANA